jgi:hypothetical protein
MVATERRMAFGSVLAEHLTPPIGGVSPPYGGIGRFVKGPAIWRGDAALWRNRNS